MTKLGTIILLPNTIGNPQEYLNTAPKHLKEAFDRIDGLIAESTTGAHRFLSLFLTPHERRDFPITLFRGKKDLDAIDFTLEPITKGQCWGVISDSGLPAIADPASYLVAKARRKHIQVEALYGPCAVTQSLMLSGLSGQSFAFHGYLSRQPDERIKQLQELENISSHMKQTQIIMESPYRAQPCFEALIETLHEDTQLAICLDLDLPTQEVHVDTINQWRKKKVPQVKDRLPVFLFFAQRNSTPSFISTKKRFSKGRRKSRS